MPLTHAIPPYLMLSVGGSLSKVATGIAVASGFFSSVLSAPNSDVMRHVSGDISNNPVTRASQSRERGRILERGG